MVFMPMRMLTKSAEIDIIELGHLQSVQFDDLGWAAVGEEKPSGGVVGFIRLAFKQALDLCAFNKVAVRGAREEGKLGGGESQIANLLRAFGKDKPVHEHVDMGVNLAECHLLGHIPSAVWPHTNAACKLNKKIKGLLQSGQEAAFVAVDRKRLENTRKDQKTGKHRTRSLEDRGFKF